MDPFNALSTATTARKIPSLQEAPPAKVMLCTLVMSRDLEKDLDATKEVNRGTNTPSAKMAMVCGHSTPRDEGQASHHQRAKVPLVPEAMERAWLMVSPLTEDREGALIGHAYTSHYGDPHSEEGDRPASTCGPFEQ
jgi:hypothetical protein